MNLSEILQKIELLRKNVDKNLESNLNWNDYEFGKNFCNSIKRNNTQTEKEIKFIIKYLRLKPKSKILDLGCGDGRLSIELAKKGFFVTAIDLNEFAIEKGIKEAKDLNIKFINEDILNFKTEEKFSSVLIVFNHFGIFNKNQINKLLKKIYSSLEDNGKLLIETNSINYGININGLQEWKIYNNWLAGDYPQLVLTDNYYFKNNIYIRKDYSIGINNFILKEFIQKLYLYNIEELKNLLSSNLFKTEQIYSDWEGNLFQDNDENIILIAKK